MKYPFFLFFIGLIFSCSDSDDITFAEESDFQGSWLLVGQYIDPGDGSGDFENVDSGKTIQFFADGSFTSKGSLCMMNTESDSESNGIYVVMEKLNEYSAENYLTPENCDFEDFKVMLQFDGSNLLLSYQCFEGCVQKYAKR